MQILCYRVEKQMRFMIKNNENNPYIVSFESSTLKIIVKGTEEEQNIVGDICDFLNDKYIDKEINQEWPEINPEERIKYHREQIKKLENGSCAWNEHGTGVE